MSHYSLVTTSDISEIKLGLLQGDVMGLTLFNENVDEATFDKMYDGCSTVLGKIKDEE